VKKREKNMKGERTAIVGQMIERLGIVYGGRGGMDGNKFYMILFY
jgi:hypothetical protein